MLSEIKEEKKKIRTQTVFNLIFVYLVIANKGCVDQLVVNLFEFSKFSDL